MFMGQVNIKWNNRSILCVVPYICIPFCYTLHTTYTLYTAYISSTANKCFQCMLFSERLIDTCMRDPITTRLFFVPHGFWLLDSSKVTVLYHISIFLLLQSLSSMRFMLHCNSYLSSCPISTTFQIFSQ